MFRRFPIRLIAPFVNHCMAVWSSNAQFKDILWWLSLYVLNCFVATSICISIIYRQLLHSLLNMRTLLFYVANAMTVDYLSDNGNTTIHNEHRKLYQHQYFQIMYSIYASKNPIIFQWIGTHYMCQIFTLTNNTIKISYLVTFSDHSEMLSSQ